MALSTYLARVKDQSGTRVAEFAGRGRPTTSPGGLQRVSYSKMLRSPCAWVIQIDGLDDRIQYLDIDNDDVLDSQVEFWRYGGAPYLDWIADLPSYRRDNSLPGWYKDFEGFVRGMEFRQDETGRDIFISTGVGYNAMLAAETILYPVGSIYATKATVAETAIKEYVEENIGPSATTPTRERSGVMPGLTIQADASTGILWYGDRAYKNLFDVANEIAEYTVADWFVVGTGAATFEFQWADGQWGLDRTIGNTDGNKPIIFASTYNNVTNISYAYSRTNEINTVDVLGVGRSGDRTLETVTDGGESDSPWGRRAVARENKQTYVQTELQDTGYKVLTQQRVKRVFSFTAQQTEFSRYGIDWDMGYLASVFYRGRQFSQKILGIQVSLDQSGRETIRPVCEDIS